MTITEVWSKISNNPKAEMLWRAAKKELGLCVPIGVVADWMIDNQDRIDGLEAQWVRGYAEALLQLYKDDLNKLSLVPFTD